MRRRVKSCHPVMARAGGRSTALLSALKPKSWMGSPAGHEAFATATGAQQEGQSMVTVIQIRPCLSGTDQQRQTGNRAEARIALAIIDKFSPAARRVGPACQKRGPAQRQRDPGSAGGRHAPAGGTPPAGGNGAHPRCRHRADVTQGDRFVGAGSGWTGLVPSGVPGPRPPGSALYLPPGLPDAGAACGQASRGMRTMTGWWAAGSHVCRGRR